MRRLCRSGSSTEEFSFAQVLTGQTKVEPRWKRCTRAVDSGMGEALAVPFVKEKLGVEGKQGTLEMVKSIESAMEKNLSELDWMDDATRAHAIEKVRKLANKIGFPDKFRSYDALAIDRRSYAANLMRAHAFEMRRDLAKIGKAVDHSEWDMTPPTVNAFYDPSMNEMQFPAGILQAPYFSLTAPAPTNFGGIGLVMGHELTHAFDAMGRKFDGDGNMTDWWSAKVAGEFERRTECVENQFASYVAVDDVHVNGKLTLDENIADLGGLKLACGLAAREGAGDAGRGPAVLHRLRAGMVRGRAPRDGARTRADQRSLAVEVARRRADLEHGLLCRGVLLAKRATGWCDRPDRNALYGEARSDARSMNPLSGGESSFVVGSRRRLTKRDAGRFEGDTLLDAVGRVVCEAECLPRRELFESWEIARRNRAVASAAGGWSISRAGTG